MCVRYDIFESLLLTKLLVTNINPFRKAFVETESPDSDPIFRLETDEEQFRRHMEWFREVEGMGSLPDDDGEEGERPPNGYIHFDKQGKLWYRQHGRSKWGRWPNNLLI